MKRTTLGLWLAVCGAAVVIFQLTPYGLHFYQTGKRLRDGWLGIPHTADLMLLAAAVAIVMAVLTMLGRNPISGRAIGLLIGFLGLLTVLQLGYRMLAPPFVGKPASFNGIFGLSCYYYCWPSMATKGTLLPGVWLALGGSAAIMLGGFIHAMSRVAGQTMAAVLPTDHQTGANSWLLLAATGAVGSFVAGYSMFVFYTLHHVKRGLLTFSGWMATPHTGGLVLGVTLAVIGLVWIAAKRRSRVSPMGLGAVITLLGAISASRIYYRIIEPPFPAVRGPREVELAAYISLGLAGVVVLAGIVYALSNLRKTAQVAPDQA